MLGNAQEIVQLKTPMIVFLIGAFIAASVYFPLISVANAPTNNITGQVTDFFLNKKDVETMQGYGLNQAGRAVVMLCFS